MVIRDPKRFLHAQRKDIEYVITSMVVVYISNPPQKGVKEHSEPGAGKRPQRKKRGVEEREENKTK